MKKLILIPITLTTLTPMVSMVSCNQDPTPEPTKARITINGLNNKYTTQIGNKGATGEISVILSSGEQELDITSICEFEIQSEEIEWNQQSKQFTWSNQIDIGEYKQTIKAKWGEFISDEYRFTLEIQPREEKIVIEGLAESYYSDPYTSGQTDQFAVYYLPKDSFVNVDVTNDLENIEIYDAGGVVGVSYDLNERRIYWDDTGKPDEVAGVVVVVCYLKEDPSGEEPIYFYANTMFDIFFGE